MISIVSEQIDAYCEKHTTPLSPLFDDLRKQTYEKTTAPQMQVGHLEGSFLKFLVASSKANLVVEFGTFTGFSSLAMAEALPDNGKLFTCDIDPVNTAIAREFWAKSPHGKKIELLLGPGLESIKKITQPIEFVFIDADKQNYLNYWEAVMPKLKPGGLIVVDNVLWSGRVLDPKEASDKSIAEFNEHALKDRRVDVVLLPVRDGMLLARKLPQETIT